MKAARYHGRRDLRVEEIDEPETRPGTVKIAVKACGICGADLHEYASGPAFIPTQPHVLTGEAIPVVMGHEFSGEIVEIGEDVDGLSVGDAVAVEPIHRCHRCPSCARQA